MTQEPEITTISEKGQVVIPKKIREELKIKPKTKFVVLAKDNVIIMKPFELPDPAEDLARLFKEIDKKKLNISEKEVLEEIQAYRAKKRGKSAR